MKRILALLCSFVFAYGAFASCGKAGVGGSEDSDGSQQQSSSNNQPIEEYSPQQLSSNGVGLQNYKIVIS